MPIDSKGKCRQNWRQKFAPSFIEVVQLKPGETCSLKKHFKTSSVMREVVGYYEKMAAIRPDRFVFTQVNHIHTKKWKEGADEGAFSAEQKKDRQPFSLTWIKKAVECTRELGIITVRMQGKNAKGARVWGVKVLRHDDLACQRDDGLCLWIDGDPFVPRYLPKILGFNDDWTENEREVLSHRVTDVDVTIHGPDHDCPDCELARRRMEDPVVVAYKKTRK